MNSRFLVQPTLLEAIIAKKDGLKIRTVSVRVRLGAPLQVARIGQQLLIRHPESVNKGVLAAANPGGSQGVPADTAVEDKLNDPNISDDQKPVLLFPPGDGEATSSRR